LAGPWPDLGRLNTTRGRRCFKESTGPRTKGKGGKPDQQRENARKKKPGKTREKNNAEKSNHRVTEKNGFNEWLLCPEKKEGQERSMVPMRKIHDDDAMAFPATVMFVRN